MKKKLFLFGLFVFLIFGSFSIAFADHLNDKIYQSIVKIRAIIPSHARTARLLGTRREGNGVIIDSDGLIVTTGYLILEAETIEIEMHNGLSLEAEFVGYDFDTGLGLLRAEIPEDISPLKLGNSSSVRSKDPVLVASFGGQDLAQAAYVVIRDDFAGYWEYLLENAIFTSPPIQQYGGAALIGSDGDLLGIGSLYTRLMVSGIGSVPSNVFIPINRLKPILSALKSGGYLLGSSRPWLGLFANEVQGHVIVISTTIGGPADRAGISINNIILEVNKEPIADLADFYRKVWALGQSGIDVPLKILQGTKIREVTIHSGNRDQFFDFKQSALTQLVMK